MCKFLHIRPTTEANFAAGFVEVVTNKGGKTVAYEVVDDTLRYAVATCSSRDNFCRKTGRTLAAGRLKSDRLSITLRIDAEDRRDPEEILRNIVTV